MTHISSAPDPLDIALCIAARRGLDLCLNCLAVSTEEAGVLDAPLRDSGDLDSDDVAILDTLLREYRLGDDLCYTGQWTAMQAVVRLRIVARIASLVLPPCVHDYEGRFAVVLDEDGHLPNLIDAQNTLSLHVRRLEGYLAEHDSGEWIDPNVIAGQVANVHDAARAAEVLLGFMQSQTEPSS